MCVTYVKVKINLFKNILWLCCSWIASLFLSYFMFFPRNFMPWFMRSLAFYTFQLLITSISYSSFYSSSCRFFIKVRFDSFSSSSPSVLLYFNSVCYFILTNNNSLLWWIKKNTYLISFLHSLPKSFINSSQFLAKFQQTKKNLSKSANISRNFFP